MSPSGSWRALPAIAAVMILALGGCGRSPARAPVLRQQAPAVNDAAGNVAVGQIAAARAMAVRRSAVAREAAQAAARRRERARARYIAQHAAPSPAAVVPPAPAQPSGTPQQIAAAMMPEYGWSGTGAQFECLYQLWQRESGWSVTAENPTTGAYGVAQALPADKMASAGPDWQTDASVQIKWGLSYIQATYGTPCSALNSELTRGWY